MIHEFTEFLELRVSTVKNLEDVLGAERRDKNGKFF